MASSSTFYERVGDYVVRLATLDDFEAVVDIDKNLLHGIDYLPAMYHKFMQAEGDLLFVAEENGVPISFFMTSVVDCDPETLISMGGRISISRRGQGVWRIFSRSVGRMLMMKFPKLRYTVFVTSEVHTKPDSHQLLSRMRILRCHTTVGVIGNGLSTYQPPSNVRQLNYQEALDLLNGGNLFEEFIGRYFTDYTLGMLGLWRPIKINKRSLKKTFAAVSKIFITTEGELSSGDQTEKIRSVVTVGRMTSLSYGYVLQTKSGVYCQVIFFGDDALLAGQHEVEYCRHLATIFTGNVNLTLIVPHSIDFERIAQSFDQVIGKHEDYYNAPAILGKSPLMRPANL